MCIYLFYLYILAIYIWVYRSSFHLGSERSLGAHRSVKEGLTKAGLQPEQARQAAVRLLRDGGGSVEFSRFVAALVPSCAEVLKRGVWERLGRFGRPRMKGNEGKMDET